MSYWNILGRLAISDKGEMIQKVSDTISISSDGITYSKMGDITIGSDGSFFTQMGNFSTDGSLYMVGTATGLGAVFINRNQASTNFDEDEGSK